MRSCRLEDRQFVAYFIFQGWWEISLGASVDLRSPNLELHFPFGMFKIGWSAVHVPLDDKPNRWGLYERY